MKLSLLKTPILLQCSKLSVRPESADTTVRLTWLISQRQRQLATVTLFLWWYAAFFLLRVWIWQADNIYMLRFFRYIKVVCECPSHCDAMLQLWTLIIPFVHTLGICHAGLSTLANYFDGQLFVRHDFFKAKYKAFNFSFSTVGLLFLMVL